MGNQEIQGAAVVTELAADMAANATSFQIASAASWPAGGSRDFVVTIGRGTASEERILCASRAGLVITVATGGRGYDGTAATAHTTGDAVEHGLAGATIQELIDHMHDDGRDDHSQYLTPAEYAALHNTTSAHGSSVVDHGLILGLADDDHTQYMRADGTRHDLQARHGTAVIADDAITTAKILNANVTQAKLANDSVGSAQIIADNVGTSEIAPLAVTSAEIANDAVIAGKIAPAAVEAGDLAAGAISLIGEFGGTAIRPVIYCTSGSRPGSVIEGQLIYESDTDQVMRWSGTKWHCVSAKEFRYTAAGTGQGYAGAGPFTVTGVITITDPFGVGVPYRVWTWATILIGGTNGESWDMEVRLPSGGTIISSTRAGVVGGYAHGVTEEAHHDMPDGGEITMSGALQRVVGSNGASTFTDARFLRIQARAIPL